MTKISIITATLNSQKTIRRLVKSINNQTDKNFEWIVKDGMSKDKTIDIIKKNIRTKNIKIIKNRDCGIYDALNIAIKKCNTEYYLVAGSDDELNENAIKNFNLSIDKHNKVDLVAASWVVNNKILSPKKNFGWLFGMLGVSSCHSVATLIKKKLHNYYGFYDLKYPICADQLFIKKSIYGNSNILRKNFISGKFYVGGNSSLNTFDFLTEQLKIQLLTEKSKSIQLIFFILRLLKNYKRII